MKIAKSSRNAAFHQYEQAKKGRLIYGLLSVWFIGFAFLVVGGVIKGTGWDANHQGLVAVSTWITLVVGLVFLWRFVRCHLACKELRELLGLNYRPEPLQFEPEEPGPVAKAVGQAFNTWATAVKEEGKKSYRHMQSVEEREMERVRLEQELENARLQDQIDKIKPRQATPQLSREELCRKKRAEFDAKIDQVNADAEERLKKTDDPLKRKHVKNQRDDAVYELEQERSKWLY